VVWRLRDKKKETAECTEQKNDAVSNLRIQKSNVGDHAGSEEKGRRGPNTAND
jgi:hypothetical protein